MGILSVPYNLSLPQIANYRQLNVERLGFDLPKALEGLSFVANGIDRKGFSEGKNTKLPECSVKIFTLLTGISRSEVVKLR